MVRKERGGHEQTAWALVLITSPIMTKQAFSPVSLRSVFGLVQRETPCIGLQILFVTLECVPITDLMHQFSRNSPNAREPEADPA